MSKYLLGSAQIALLSAAIAFPAHAQEGSNFAVEDEIIVAIEIAEQLRELGFQDVRTAHTLRAAEELVADFTPDLALLDVNLGNGERSTDLGLMLRERGCIVVFASGYNKSELSARLQSFEFLEKPIAKDDIATTLTRLLMVAPNQA